MSDGLLQLQIARAEEELEDCVQLVRDCGLATGQADSHEDLMREVLEQVEGLRAEKERLRAWLIELQEALAGWRTNIEPIRRLQRWGREERGDE